MMSLQEKIKRITQAALLELDAKWRNGTANAAFRDERTLPLLRGKAGIHESDVAFVFELIESGRLHLQIGHRHEAETEIEQPEEHYFMPEWATGRATSSTELGAQLCTRDGRRCGNAVVMESHKVIDKPFVIVCTDAGNLMTLSPSEVDELFHPARWLMDPNTTPGAIRHTIDIRNALVKKYVEADDNGLPKGSPESDSFILEHAMQVGFEMIDDDGDAYVCNSRQVVALVKPYKDAASGMSRDAWHRQIRLAFEASGMSVSDGHKVIGGRLMDTPTEKFPAILSAMKAWRKS